MPCNCDHLKATRLELEISRVACLLDELDDAAKLGPSLEYRHNPKHWDGYHPAVYGRLIPELADRLTARLCDELQQLGDDVKKYSLEMQVWWRDHQDADRKRLATELKALKEAKARSEALAKLTPYERELLGLAQ